MFMTWLTGYSTLHCAWMVAKTADVTKIPPVSFLQAHGDCVTFTVQNFDRLGAFGICRREATRGAPRLSHDLHIPSVLPTLSKINDGLQAPRSTHLPEKLYGTPTGNVQMKHIITSPQKERRYFETKKIHGSAQGLSVSLCLARQLLCRNLAGSTQSKSSSTSVKLSINCLFDGPILTVVLPLELFHLDLNVDFRSFCCTFVMTLTGGLNRLSCLAFSAFSPSRCCILLSHFLLK